MKLSFNIIQEREHIAAGFGIPLRLTRLGPDDLASHMTEIRPLLTGLAGSYQDMAEYLSQCFERFDRTFKWN